MKIQEHRGDKFAVVDDKGVVLTVRHSRQECEDFISETKKPKKKSVVVDTQDEEQDEE